MREGKGGEVRGVREGKRGGKGRIRDTLPMRGKDSEGRGEGWKVDG